jgi:hypothetical protein
MKPRVLVGTIVANHNENNDEILQISVCGL